MAGLSTLPGPYSRGNPLVMEEAPTHIEAPLPASHLELLPSANRRRIDEYRRRSDGTQYPRVVGIGPHPGPIPPWLVGRREAMWRIWGGTVQGAVHKCLVRLQSLQGCCGAVAKLARRPSSQNGSSRVRVSPAPPKPPRAIGDESEESALSSTPARWCGVHDGDDHNEQAL